MLSVALLGCANQAPDTATDRDAAACAACEAR
jgi:hypothetical protein